MPVSLIKEEESHILKLLPILLRRDDQFRKEVAIVLSEALVRKDEINRVLEEIRLSREETNKRFEEQREETNKRFEAMIAEMKQMREETNRRFEDSERRFEAFMKEMHEFRKETRQVIQDVSIKIDTVGARWGIFTEKTLRNTLKELLLKNLKITEIRELKIEDEKGYVFGYPQEVQIDLLIKDGEDYLVEISSSAGSGDVTTLSRKAKLYEAKTSKKPKPVFVCVNMRDEGKDACKKLGIQLITYDEIKEG
ncbi:MAG: DUF3782 domain-containing protein [bacterium]